MSEGALECALALRRAPLMGHTLRDRPLPSDIGHLLEIAAGSSTATAHAAGITGEPPDVLRDASRFYLQQVLLFPEADAYRVLGVSSDAPIDRIRQHHRNLQRWLHPDRSGDRWEAVYATRVNQAWNQLRTSGGRARYDEMIRREEVSFPSADPEARPRWRPVEVERPRWSLHPAVLVGIVMCVCVLLGWQAVRRSLEMRSSPEGMGVLDMQISSPPPREPKRGGANVEESVRPEPLNVVRSTKPALPQELAITRATEVPVAERSVVETRDAPSPTTTFPTAPLAKAAAAMVPVAPVVAKERVAARIDPPPTRIDAPSNSGRASVESGLNLDPAMYARVRGRGVELLGYIADPRQSAPPIWNSVSSMEAATSVRNIVQRDAVGRQAWSTPTWRIAADRAEFTAELRGGRESLAAGAPRGRVQASMRWREGDWRVDGVRWETLP